MDETVNRELILPATTDEVWAFVTGTSWLAEAVELDLRPGGGASFRDGERVKTGWIEAVEAPADCNDRGELAYWWAAEGEPATRVQITIEPAGWAGSRLRIVELRPLQALELVGLPLGGIADSSYGPTLLAA